MPFWLGCQLPQSATLIWHSDSHHWKHKQSSLSKLVTRIIRELSLSLISFHTYLIARHQQLEKRLALGCGEMEIKPSLWKMKDHTCWAKKQGTRMCWINSWALSQWGQAAGLCGHPRLARWSAVQQWLLMASQMKNLLQKDSNFSNSLPWSETDGPKEVLDLESLHRCWSFTPCCRFKTSTISHQMSQDRNSERPFDITNTTVII